MMHLDPWMEIKGEAKKKKNRERVDGLRTTNETARRRLEERTKSSKDETDSGRVGRRVEILDRCFIWFLR